MGRVISVFFLFWFVLAGVFLLRNEQIDSFVSPIPKVFGTTNSPQIANSWFPKATIGADYSSLVVGAKSAILVDYDTGQVIFAKDEKARLPAASTIKIMTALVALEKAKLTDQFLVSAKASKVGENSMGLTAGEKLTLEELLYGLMLVSGNDAAVAIAEGVAGSEDEFVKLMNGKVRQLGLGDSKFVNATGLDLDGNIGYSAAYDLSVIAHYVWENYPLFGEITSTYNKNIAPNENHASFDLYNDTNLLTTYPGVRGIKPGFTWEAGLCLVTYAENEGKRLIGVIMGSDDRRGEMVELLDYGFESFGIIVEHPALDL